MKGSTARALAILFINVRIGSSAEAFATWTLTPALAPSSFTIAVDSQLINDILIVKPILYLGSTPILFPQRLMES